MRTVNNQKLKQYIDQKGPGSREALASYVKVSFSLIQKLAAGKTRNAPRESTQIKIAQFTGIPLDELFPEINDATLSENRQAQ